MKNANTKEYWDKKWGTNRKIFNRWVDNRIAYLVPEDSSVLDIGCGQGRVLSMVKQKNCKVYGLDISPIAIELLKSNGIDGEVANAENMDKIEGKYDIVICAHLFEHITKHAKLIKNIRRLCGKFAILAVPDNICYPDPVGEHVRKYSKEQFTKLISKHFDKIEDHSLPHHIVYVCS